MGVRGPCREGLRRLLGAMVEFVRGKPGELVAVVSDLMCTAGLLAPRGARGCEDDPVLRGVAGASTMIDDDDEAGAITVATGADCGRGSDWVADLEGVQVVCHERAASASISRTSAGAYCSR